MTRTFVRQEQVAGTRDSIAGFDDAIAPASTMESGAVTIDDDLNAIRSMLHYLRDVAQGGNWYDALAVPSALDTGSARGIDSLNSNLHAIERKRVLRNVYSLVGVVVGGGNNFVILGGGELPSNTTAAVGSVTTEGTVAAAHGGTFGTHSLTEVSGSSAIAPKNLGPVFAAASRDPILSSGRQVYALLHTETATDGHTITTTTTTRAQLSFVRLNAAGDDLEACPVADIEGLTIAYTSVERIALEDTNEQDFLKGAVVDISAGASITRQEAYDNQGTTPVDVTTNSIVDLEGPGIEWQIRDDLEAILFRLIEGSAGGTSQLQIGAAVDTLNIDAIVVDVAAGMTVRSGGTRPLTVGVTDGYLASTSGDLGLRAAAELLLDDVNQATSAWAQTAGIKLSDTPTEWDDFRTLFGEVSLLSSIATAYQGDVRSKVHAVVTSDVAADADVNGPGTAHSNTDVDLPAYDTVTFVDDVEVYVNGILQRNGANAGANEDVYPGGDPGDGDLRFEFALQATGLQPDVITVIVNGQ